MRINTEHRRLLKTMNSILFWDSIRDLISG